MAFVNEEVPENDRERLDLEIFIHPLGGYPIGVCRWVIDREMNVFIIRLGGGRRFASPEEGPRAKEYFALYWKGQVIKFETHYDETGEYLDRDRIGWWEVLPVNVPELFEHESLQIEEVIRSGLEAMGSCLGIRQRLKKTVIKFVD